MNSKKMRVGIDVTGASKISVVPGTVHQDFGLLVSDSVKQEVCARYQLPATYFLTVATTEPKKNLGGLLDAYVQLRQRYGSECPDLIIVDRQDWNCGDIRHYMETLRGRVFFLEHVPDQDLIALYQMAICFIFPSLYEGFGLPVLEAMASGCPVITTNSASLPEISRDAAFLVETGNVQALMDAIWQVYQDKGLRRRMIANGCVQATDFAWEQTARLYQDVYIASA